MTDVIVFLDALSPREVGNGFISDITQGKLDAGTPRVTPRVMSSIYTGLPPERNGLLEVSKYGGEMSSRPRKSTFIEQALREDNNVLCVGMPFCIPFNTNQDGSLLHGTAMGGNQHVIPNNMNRVANLPSPAADMVEDNPGYTYNSFRDQVISQIRMFKEGLRRWSFDVGILGIRLVDSYCHFQHTEKGPDGELFRHKLIDNIDEGLKSIYNEISGDLFVFSDHGQTTLETVFRINLWLQEEGYMEYKADIEFIDQLDEYVNEGEDHPVDVRVENQFSSRSPGVVIDEEKSQVVCDDPFDSCLTLLCDREEFDEDQFRRDLLSTGLYRSVDYKWEIYDEDGEYYDLMPDIIPDRGEGVFVSGNLHPEPIGMGWYRTGVHDKYGCYGSTTQLSASGEVTPEQLYSVIKDFIGIEGEVSPLDPQAVRQFTQQELESAYNDIKEQMKRQKLAVSEND